MNPRHAAFLAAFVVAIVSGCAGDSGTGPAGGEHVVAVAAAADLRYAFDDLIVEFHRRRPEIRVDVSYGSSGNFVAQLEKHAPFDLFLSADSDYPRHLIDAGLAERDSFFVYGIGHVVVWARKDSALDVEKLGVQALLEPSVQKIAIANPRHAPYGRSAEAALKGLKLYDQVKDRLVLGDNVAQTAQFIQSGAADVGLISLAQALAPTLREQGRFGEVPSDAYPRLEQAGVILSWARDRPAAEAVRDFITGPDGRAVLMRYGFAFPGE